MPYTDTYMWDPDSTRERFKVHEAYRKNEEKDKEMNDRPYIETTLLREIRKSVKKTLCKEDQFASDYIDLVIRVLPLDMVKKVYFWWFRLYWRTYVPVTARVPQWQARKTYVDKTLWNAIDQNIHFLHLPFNTLEINKKWIMGCQCDFCKKGGNLSKKSKQEFFRIADKKHWFFPLLIPNTTVTYQYAPDNDDNVNNVNNTDESLWDGGHKLNKPGLRANYHYDCFYDTPYEENIKWAIRDTRRPLEFSYREPISCE